MSKGAEAHGLRNVVAVSLAAFFLAFGGAIPRAEEEPIFTITFKDGAVSPRRLEVPANRRFQLNLVNNGDTPAEFESNELRKEKLRRRQHRSLCSGPSTPANILFLTIFIPMRRKRC